MVLPDLNQNINRLNSNVVILNANVVKLDTDVVELKATSVLTNTSLQAMDCSTKATAVDMENLTEETRKVSEGLKAFSGSSVMKLFK